MACHAVVELRRGRHHRRRGAIDFLEVVVSHGSLCPFVQEHRRFKFQVLTKFPTRRRVGFSEPARFPFYVDRHGLLRYIRLV